MRNIWKKPNNVRTDGKRTDGRGMSPGRPSAVHEVDFP